MNEKKSSLLVLGLFLMLSFCFNVSAFAQEKVAMEDKIIASTFKALAKVFVAIADINKLRKDNIDKLNKMDKEKFQERYVKVYQVIKDLPPKLKMSFSITKGMTKDQVIGNTESIDKKKLYAIIDSLPDAFIAKHFKRYLNEKKQALQKNNIPEQINKFWNKILQKSKVSTLPLSPH